MVLFEAGEIFESRRLRFSVLVAEAVESMTWLAGALAPEWRVEALRSMVEDGAGVLIEDGAGEQVGAAVVRREAPAAGCAMVPLIAIAPGRRFRGLGGEAGLALEGWLRRKGVRRVFAPVPDGRGLALYFWLRLGYRPLVTSEAPGGVLGVEGESRAGIWLVRDEA